VASEEIPSLQQIASKENKADVCQNIKDYTLQTFTYQGRILSWWNNLSGSCKSQKKQRIQDFPHTTQCLGTFPIQ